MSDGKEMGVVMCEGFGTLYTRNGGSGIQYIPMGRCGRVVAYITTVLFFSWTNFKSAFYILRDMDIAQESCMW